MYIVGYILSNRVLLMVKWGLLKNMEMKDEAKQREWFDNCVGFVKVLNGFSVFILTY